MNKEFIKSIKSAEESNGQFFTVNFGDTPFKFYFEEDACNWVWNYKYIYRTQTIDIKSELNTSLEKNKIALINYFYNFIIQDISNLNSYLSKSITSSLDIGAGIGLFDLFLAQILGPNTSFDLIEVNELLEIEHVTNNPEDTKQIETGNTIKPVETLKKLMIKNKAHNINIIESNEINQYFDNKKYDLILSFRSWGFLYDIDLYKDFVINTLNPDGIVITDLSIFDDSIDKFSQIFKDVTLINEAPNNKRFIGKYIK